MFDFTQVPVQPGSKRSDESYEFVPVADEGESMGGDRDENFKQVEKELIAQIRVSHFHNYTQIYTHLGAHMYYHNVLYVLILQTCTNNTEHFTKLGDIASANKYVKIFTHINMNIYK